MASLLATTNVFPQSAFQLSAPAGGPDAVFRSNGDFRLPASGVGWTLETWYRVGTGSGHKPLQLLSAATPDAPQPPLECLVVAGAAGTTTFDLQVAAASFASLSYDVWHHLAVVLEPSSSSAPWRVAHDGEVRSAAGLPIPPAGNDYRLQWLCGAPGQLALCGCSVAEGASFPSQSLPSPLKFPQSLPRSGRQLALANYLSLTGPAASYRRMQDIVDASPAGGGGGAAANFMLHYEAEALFFGLGNVLELTLPF
jgi:hypothetical protein